MNVQDKIREQLGKDKIVLYMKGNPQAPQCGFSAKVVQLLAANGAKFGSYDVLSDPNCARG